MQTVSSGDIQMVYCSECGRQNEDDARFCAKCGAPLNIGGESGGLPERRNYLFGLPGIVIISAILLVILLSIALTRLPLFSGTVTGSGNLVTEERNFNGFTAVDAEKGIDVDITQSGMFSVSVTADDNVIKRVQISKSGETLYVRKKSGVYKTVVVRIEITMPQLRELVLSTGSHGTVEGFHSADEITIQLSGGSHVEMQGSAESLILSASGGSDLDLSTFAVQEADVDLSGGSHGTVNVNGRLDADLSGGSHLYYIGETTLGDIQKSGGSTLDRK